MSKILIIEDDLQLQESYKTKLIKSGYEVLQATDGEAGLKFAKENKPDLIILDIMLPIGPDGFVVLEKLKHDPETESIPVFVSTNLDDQVIKALDAGAVWYFVKANTPLDEIVAKIKEVLG